MMWLQTQTNDKQKSILAFSLEVKQRSKDRQAELKQSKWGTHIKKTQTHFFGFEQWLLTANKKGKHNPHTEKKFCGPNDV